MELSRLYYLWERYQRGVINKAERHELMEMLGASSNEEAIKAFVAREMERLEQSNPEVDSPLGDQRAKEILSRITSTTRRPAVATMRSRRWWIWRAAAVLLLISCCGYLWMHSNQHKKTGLSVSPTLNNDIAPGRNKAVLTLANGQQIVLDRTHNGQVARQGNSQVLKVQPGLLSYNPLQTQNDQPAGHTYNTLSTPPGGQYQLVLPDGSKVWLNAASSIRFPTAFTGDLRAVEVTGEVYFEIKKKAAMPFIVTKGTTEVQVLGTNFNVNTYDDEENMKITLVEGSVRVIQRTTGNSQRLTPGQQVQINRSGAIKLIQQADTSRVLAWKEGRFAFHGNIEGIMRQIARWYNVEVEYRGDVVNNAYAGAISRYEKVSKVLQMLTLTGTIHFEIEKSSDAKKAGKIIVTD